MSKRIGIIGAVALAAAVAFFAPPASAAVVCNGYGCYETQPPVVIAPIVPLARYYHHPRWWRWHRRHW